MPDLTFSEIPVVRNVLGKTISSETWLNGEVVTKAEATRKRLPNVSTSAAEAVAQAAAARGASSYDAGHWYWQPIGGRAVRRYPKPRFLSSTPDLTPRALSLPPSFAERAEAAAFQGRPQHARRPRVEGERVERRSRRLRPRAGRRGRR